MFGLCAETFRGHETYEGEVKVFRFPSSMMQIGWPKVHSMHKKNGLHVIEEKFSKKVAIFKHEMIIKKHQQCNIQKYCMTCT